MARRILILDTSVLCCLLQVPGKDMAGSNDDAWDHKRISALVQTEVDAGSTLVLPLASIVETGNHISQAPRNRFHTAERLAELIRLAANETTPWAAFTDQADLWGPEQLIRLADEWPKLADANTSIGDATIKNVAEYYSGIGWDVEIVTGDQGLKAYQPAKPVSTPRRRL